MLALWIVLGVLGLVVVYDLVQKKHAILRNFPILGHFRYLLEMVGPELRQYIVTGNDDERPFTRDQRRWVYASAKQENPYFGFGTDNELELSPNYLIVRPSAFPIDTPPPGAPGHDPDYRIPAAKVVGATRGRRHAFRPASVINVSGMSFGSLSGRAVEAINRGCRRAGCLQNTGEGGIAPHHLHGGDLVYQIGTGYFGCRDEHGRFSMERLLETIHERPVRAIEIKLSQGAKPGLGGLLPAAKVTETIARIRGVPVGQDVASPASHAAFGNVDAMLDFVEQVAEATGLPVGIKSAVGNTCFWHDLARLMEPGHRGVDFISVDGGEGGTGAAPLVFSDHVALPFFVGFSTVFRIFAENGVHERVVFAGAGKLGFPERALFALALGCDLVHVAREAMMAVGCIQAQRCHTGHCPAGVATQNRWLARGLDPRSKADRLAHYVVALRKDVLRLTRAVGVEHPALVTSDDFTILDEQFSTAAPRAVFGYEPGWGRPSAEDRREVVALMRDLSA